MKRCVRFLAGLAWFALALTLPAATTDLFFSEYVEGSSFNKAIEIYNGTGVSVDLSSYVVERYTNGSPNVSASLTLSGTLNNEDAFVIVHGSASTDLKAKADTLHSIADFNGDDAMVLSKNGTRIDVIGVIGVDPGSAWTEGSLSTVDQTLRRKSTVCAGITTFALAAEWDGFATDTFDGLGAHTATCAVDYTLIFDIQHTEDTSGDSPFKDQSGITTEGVVTGIFDGGYAIQDPSGSEWRGLWIFDATNIPARGDRLRLTGTITELDGQTILLDLTAYAVLSSGNPLPAAVVLATGDVAHEKWEGVLVQYEDVIVTSADLGNGEWGVDDSSGMARIGYFGAYTYTPVVDNHLSRITGIMETGSGNFVLQPRDDDDIAVAPEVLLVINEILADPANNATGDANGDGTPDTANDEFVEIVNASTTPVDISGWTLADETSVRHTFPANTVVPAGAAVVVFAYGTPTGFFGGAIVQVSTNHALGLNNTGDTVTLKNGATVVASQNYGSNAGDDQSITRDPDVTGATFVKHTQATNANGALFSPGCRVDGSSFIATPIHTVQGSGETSPMNGQAGITVEGIVVGDFQAANQLGGFYLQEETLQVDANPATSEGIFVFDTSVGVSVGDMVSVTGTVTEYFGCTEITDVTNVTVIKSAAPLSPTTITLPVTAIADFEAFEGMLVSITQPLTVTGNFSLVQYGEVDLSVNGRLYTPTQMVAPGTEANTQQNLNNRSRIQLDDGSTVANPDPIPYMSGNTLRLGATLPSLTGLLHFSFDAYEIHPTTAVTFTDANARTAAPAAVAGVFKVSSFNVHNYFNGDGAGGGFPTSRGAATYEEFQRQRAKLISAMLTIDADIFGLTELENDGFGAASAIQDLVNGLNAATASSTWSFINPGLAQIGTDAITCGFVYKPELVTPVGALAILDNTVDPAFDPTNRPSLAQTFQDTSGEKFTLVLNHFRSKSSACPGDGDAGDGQGNCNQTRVEAATALTNWLEGDPTGGNDSDFLLIGDFNAYAQEDPITVIESAGYANLEEQTIGAGAYSYVFAAQSGAIDHAFVTPTLNSQITGATIWHINADEPLELDYASSNPAELYDPGPYRSSDHDPVIVGLELAPIAIELSVFLAVYDNRQVMLTWKTASEMNMAGFNLLRSDSRDGLYAKINDQLIVSRGDSGKGADYEEIDPAGLPGSFYKLESVELDGQTKHYGPFAVTVVSDVASQSLPMTFALHPNFPNPFNPGTVIRYDLPHAEHVSIRIYDVCGRLVRLLVDETCPAGSCSATWDGRNDNGQPVPAGLYFYKMRAGQFVDVRKMMLIK